MAKGKQAASASSGPSGQELAQLAEQLRELLEQQKARQDQPEQPREEAFTADERAKLEGKPWLKAQADLAALAWERLGSAEMALDRGDEAAVRTALTEGELDRRLRGRRRQPPAVGLPVPRRQGEVPACWGCMP